MARRSYSDGSRGDEQLVRQLPALLRQHRPDLMEGEKQYRSPPGFTSWSGHWAKAVAVELALERSESVADHVGIWGAMVCQWAREIGAEPRFLSPALAQAFLQTEQPTLTPDLPRDISCFRLLLPKGTLYGEEGPEIRSVVVAEVRAMEGWLPDNFELAGGGLACIGLRETAPPTWPATCSTHRPRRSSLRTPTSAQRSGTGMPMASKAPHPAWSSSASMPCWCSCMPSTWWRGHWRVLSPPVGPVAAPMEWVEPALVG
jgi:hypothetical protein